MPPHPADRLRRKGELPSPPSPADYAITPGLPERTDRDNPDAAFDEGVRHGNGVHPPHQPSRPPDRHEK
jgi:hypothetical protein